MSFEPWLQNLGYFDVDLKLVGQLISTYNVLV